MRADDDLDRIHGILAEDPVLSAGIDRVKGLRIVKLDEWECLCSFTLATYANIPRISKMIDSLARRFGSAIVDDVNAFPSVDQLRDASIRDLEKCGLGYRAKYIYELSRTIDEKSIGRLSRLSFEDLRERLLELPGVGDKVADCSALFGFGKLEAFPIDVWMERALARLFRERGPYRKLRRFAEDRWGQYAGYAQEYLYYNERMRASTGACLFTRG